MLLSVVIDYDYTIVSSSNSKMSTFRNLSIYSVNCQTMILLSVSISICWRSLQNLSLPCWQRPRSTGPCSGLPASWSPRMWWRFPAHSWCRQDDGSPWRGQHRGNCCWSPPWCSSLPPCRWRSHSGWTQSPPPGLLSSLSSHPPHCWTSQQNISRRKTTTPGKDSS